MSQEEIIVEQKVASIESRRMWLGRLPEGVAGSQPLSHLCWQSAVRSIGYMDAHQARHVL